MTSPSQAYFLTTQTFSGSDVQAVFNIKKNQDSTVNYEIVLFPDAQPGFSATISSVAVYATDNAENNVTSSIVIKGNTSYSGLIVFFTLKGGEAGQKYRIDVSVILSTNENYTITGYLFIDNTGYISHSSGSTTKIVPIFPGFL